MWGRLIANPNEQIPPAERKREVEEALQIFRQFGDLWGESDALAVLSEVNLALQNYDEAIATGEAALEMIRTLKDSRSWEALVRTLVQAYQAVGQDNRVQAIQREYEQFSARQNSARRSRPRFFYAFVAGADYGALPVLHEERRCFGER
jgi:tetratricopeptide (TPR) repeat protein